MENNDLKYTISRSFSRKISLGNYQMADFFATHSEEILKDGFGESDLKELSNELYKRAKEDVKQAIIEFKNEEMKKEELKAENKADGELNFELELQREADEAEANK